MLGTPPDQKTQTQIDHVLVTKKKQSSHADVGRYRAVCAESDHFILTTLRQKKEAKINKIKIKIRAIKKADGKC